MGSSRGLGFVVQLTITYSFWHRLQSLFLFSPWLHSPQDVPAPTHHLCSVQVTLLMQWFWVGCPGWCQSVWSWSRLAERSQLEPGTAPGAGWEAPSWGGCWGASTQQGWKGWAWPTQPGEHRSKPASLAGKDLQHESLFCLISNGQWNFSIFFSSFFKYHTTVLVIYGYTSVLRNHQLLLPTHKNKV